MAKAAFQAVRRKIKSRMCYSDVESLVRDATCNSPYRPSNAVLRKIEELVYEPNSFEEVMRVIWMRLADAKYLRHMEKGLVVLYHLVRTCNKMVLAECQRHNGILNAIISFSASRLQPGDNIGILSRKIHTLVNDDNILLSGRAMAIASQVRAWQKYNGEQENCAVCGYEALEDNPNDIIIEDFSLLNFDNAIDDTVEDWMVEQACALSRMDNLVSRLQRLTSVTFDRNENIGMQILELEAEMNMEQACGHNRIQQLVAKLHELTADALDQRTASRELEYIINNLIRERSVALKRMDSAVSLLKNFKSCTKMADVPGNRICGVNSLKTAGRVVNGGGDVAKVEGIPELFQKSAEPQAQIPNLYDEQHPTATGIQLTGCGSDSRNSSQYEDAEDRGEPKRTRMAHKSDGPLKCLQDKWKAHSQMKYHRL